MLTEFDINLIIYTVIGLVSQLKYITSPVMIFNFLGQLQLSSWCFAKADHPVNIHKKVKTD